MQLSERAKELIPKARIVGFDGWRSLYAEPVIAIFQQADDEGHYLSDEDLAQIKALAPQTASALEIARLLREKAPQIVFDARKQVLATYPQITEPGGGLYPAERAEACWRDFWHFLRCITYGIAGEQTAYTSQEGLENMKLLYEELRVPLEAMILGLENLKTFGLEEFNPQEQAALAPYFDHLIGQMSRFRT